MRPTWDKLYIDMCHLLSERSRDTSTKLGAVVVGVDNEVVSTGYNCFPRGINDNVPERYDRPKKYFFYSHAEENSITNAARIGAKLKGCRLYVPWTPCATCARMIIQSGIIEVIVENIEPQSTNASKWKESCQASTEMFNEAGIKFRTMNK